MIPYFKNMPFWKKALLEIFDDTSKFKIIHETEQVWIIEDKYPKGKTHHLMIPKIKLIKGLAELNKSHVPLLKHMNDLLTERGYDEKTYLIGFHPKPSLWQLHLHMVTRDLSGVTRKAHREQFKEKNMVKLPDAISKTSEILFDL